MKIIQLIIFLLFTLKVFGQIPQVPTQMELGDMKLKITPKGQAVIQGHVNALYANDKFLQKMTDKAKIHFPIIEKILFEEGVPDDFKYLCIQESGITADAVSVSNAVGYWQFKDFTAREVGLIVEDEIDERKHLVYATKGAAKYLKKNYFYLKNWIYTCQSYQQGLGGTQRSVDKSLFGATKMTIDENSYWYVMKFLAHKVAYENSLKKSASQVIELKPILFQGGTKVSDISSSQNVSLEAIEAYNIWLKKTRLPNLREEYYVVIPGGKESGSNLATLETITIEMEQNNTEEIERIVSSQVVNPSVRIIIKINGKKAILANSGDIPVTLALRGGITKDKLLKYNDIIPGEEIVDNMVYYLQPKNRKSHLSTHITKENEDLWTISQKYGVRKKSLIKMNRMSLGEEPKPGRILYLNKARPRDTPIEFVNTEKVDVPLLDTIQKIKDPESQAFLDSTQNYSLKNPDKVAIITREDSLKTIDSIQKEEVIKTEENLDRSDLAIEETKITEKENVNPDDVPKSHIVSAGETLFSISKKYGLKVEDLVTWNSLTTLSLSIGQKLKLTAD